MPEALTRSAEVDRTDSTTLAVFRLAQVGMVLANLGRIPVFSTGDRDAPLLVNELWLLAIVLTGMTAAIRRGRLYLDSVSLVALLFVAVGGSSAVWNAHAYGLNSFELLVSLAYLGRWAAYAMLYVVLRNTIGRGHATSLWGPVETMLVLLALFGIFQAAFLPNFAQMVYPDSRAVVDWDVQGHRLVSTILEPNIAAGMLMIGVLVHLSMISTGAAVGRWKVAVLFVGMVLTVSRSAAVGFVVGLATLLIIRGLSRRLLRLMMVASVLGLAASPQLIRLALAYGKFSLGEGTSAGERVLSWLRALNIFSDHPIFGVGFNTFAFVSERYGYERLGTASYGSDGGLLFIAVMTGVVGLAVYCLMLGKVFTGARRVWRDPGATPDARGLSMGVVAATVAIVFHSVFVNSILTTFVMEILWVLWAIVGILSQRESRPSAVSMPRVTLLRV